MNIIYRGYLNSIIKNKNLKRLEYPSIKAIDLYANEIVTIYFFKNHKPYLYIYKHPQKEYIKSILDIDAYNKAYNNQSNISIDYTTITQNAFKQEQRIIEKFINEN